MCGCELCLHFTQILFAPPDVIIPMAARSLDRPDVRPEATLNAASRAAIFTSHIIHHTSRQCVPARLVRSGDMDGYLGSCIFSYLSLN